MHSSLIPKLQAYILSKAGGAEVRVVGAEVVGWGGGGGGRTHDWEGRA